MKKKAKKKQQRQTTVIISALLGAGLAVVASKAIQKKQFAAKIDRADKDTLKISFPKFGNASILFDLNKNQILSKE